MTRYSCIVARRAAGAISAYRSQITATLLKPELVRTTIPGCASWAPLLFGFSSGTRGTDVRLILPFRVLDGMVALLSERGWARRAARRAGQGGNDAA